MSAAVPATAAASPAPVAPHRRRRISVVALAFLVLALLVPAGCARSPSEPAAPAVPGVRHDLPGDVRPMLLPTTGEETRWTQGLAAFTAAAAYRVTDQCVRSQGVAMPDVPPPMFVRLYEIPDLDFIRRYGFHNGGPEAPPRADGKADKSIQDRCLAEGAAAVKGFRTMFGTIQLQWAQSVAELRNRPEVVEAYGAFSSCLAERGMSDMDEEKFFREADTLAQEGDTRSLADTYATCMAPVERVREPLRRQLREGFEREHSTTLKNLENQLVPQMEALRERTGAVISFPA